VPWKNSTWEIVPSVSLADAVSVTVAPDPNDVPAVGDEMLTVGATFVCITTDTADEVLLPLESYAFAVSE
jgi:hypothetical protein